MERFERVAPDIYRLKVPFGACWTGVLLIEGEKRILLDSGACAQTVDEVIVPALAAHGLRLEEIDYLALTHTHGDHVGGCARIRELAPRIKVAVFEGSLDQMRQPLVYSRRIRARFPGYSAPAPKTLTGVEPDVLIKDGGRLESLRLIHTPGHDADSCCWLDERTGTLMTGDSLQLNGTNVQGCALIMDLAGYEQALDKLRALPIEHIVCGHEYLPLGGLAQGREAAQAYLCACQSCVAHDEAFVAGMLAAGCRDVPQMARALIEEVKGIAPEYLFLPMYTVTEMMKKRGFDA